MIEAVANLVRGTTVFGTDAGRQRENLCVLVSYVLLHAFWQGLRAAVQSNIHEIYGMGG